MSIEICENCGTQWDTDFNTGEYLMDSSGNYHPVCPECEDSLFDEDGKLDFKTDDLFKLLRNRNAEKIYKERLCTNQNENGY